MGYLSVMTERQLLALAGLPANDRALIEQLIHTVFVTRFIPVTGTTRTISEEDRGAILRFTSGSAITCTLPSTLPAGFLFNFLPYGAGTITFSGTTLGGTASSGQNILGSAVKLDSGEWLLQGAA